MIDEIEIHPYAVREFTGKPLYTVIDREALEGKMLHIFTEKGKAAAYCETVGPSGLRAITPGYQSSSAALTGNVLPNQGYVEMYQHINWAGCTWRVLESALKAVVNFSGLWDCCGCFLFWGWTNADNQVSAIDVRISMNRLALAEFPNLGGNWLLVPGDAWIPDLVPFGWNDRASSMKISPI